MEEKFYVAQRVVINATSVEGIVTGIWHSIAARTQYLVRYYDTTNRKAESWMLDEEISEVTSVDSA